MSKRKRLSFIKHSPEDSKKLMSSGKHSLLKGKTFCLSSIKVIPEILIMSDHADCHQPDYSSEMSISSFTELTFAFKPSGLINSGVKTTIGNKLSMVRKSFEGACFSDKMHGCSISDTLYRFNKLYILAGSCFLTTFSKQISKEVNLLFEKEEFFDFLDKDKLFYRPVPSNRVFSKGFNFLWGDINLSSRGFYRKGGVEFFYGGMLNSIGRGELFKEPENRGVMDIDLSFEFREKGREEFFYIIFDLSNLLRELFSFSCDIPEVSLEEGVFGQLRMDMIEGKGDSLSIEPVSFSFSKGSGVELINQEGIKDNAMEVFLREEGKEINIVATRRLFSNKDRVFRELRESIYEGGETGGGHREGGFEEDGLRRRDCTSREGVFRDIDPDKNFKVFHRSTSPVSRMAEAGACQPILHGDEDLTAQPTYHGLGRQATNSLEGLLTQEKWSCPALPNEFYMGKTHAYRFYNRNFS